MFNFLTPEWEKNTIGDSTCKNLFQFQLPKTNNKSKPKVTKSVQKAASKSRKKALALKEIPNQTNFPPPKKQKKRIKKPVENLEILAPNEQPSTIPRTKNKPLNKAKLATFTNTSASKPKKLSITNKKPSKQSVTQEKRNKLKEKLQNVLKLDTKRNNSSSLRERMMERLASARFRYINEQIYTSDGQEAQKLFQKDPEAFSVYHSGYRRQCKMWPLNPLDVIIESLKKMPKNLIVADFGCGEARLGKTIKQNVHSFDLVAINERVTACDMKNVPLEKDSVNVVVFCLSLMGTNLHDYLKEANRVLQIGGVMKIAEVESRFEDVKNFIQGVECFGFKLTWKDLSHNLFYFLDFKKERNLNKKKAVPTVTLHPCLYKRR